MARKSALVVDDSKSARVILSRMLEKYDIEVDMAESAEQAIEYLKTNRPDAIFMDHLMPGMDGLQAVQAIKGNPQTAMIPIMMYTSQEGELYVGQARALGAMGVLPKQVRPVDVSKVLYELHLLPDRRDTAEPVLVPVEIDGAASRGVAGRPTVVNGIADARAPGADWARRMEATVKEQSADIRRFVVASLDSFASRIVGDVRDIVSAPLKDPLPPAAEPKRKLWPWAAALLVVSAIAATCAVLWTLSREELAKSRAENAAQAAANAEVQRSSRELAATVKELTAALAANAALTTPAGGTAGSRLEPVPYGEIPFDRSRLEVLREFLAKLQSQGFHGIVKITSASGLFCLTGNPTDGFVPASAALPVGKCDLIGNPYEESLSAQQRQSLAFANLLAGVRQRSGGTISVVIENVGSSRPTSPYPPRTESLTAGEWNRVAASNNRVEFTAEPN